MNRLYRHRLLIFGCIALVVGIVHLGVFFNQTMKDHHTRFSRSRVLLQKGLSSYLRTRRTGRNISAHYNYHDSKGSVGFKILENGQQSTTIVPNKSCIGGDCENENKIQNKPGALNFNSYNETVTKPPGFQYAYPPDALKINVISDKSLPNESYFQASSTVLNTLPERIVLHNPDLCSPRHGKMPYVLVVVPTVVNHVFDRKTIRETWGSVAYNGGVWGNTTLSKSIRILFVLGSQKFSKLDMAVIKQEAEEHGDLLLSDFVDSYRNLSLKVAVSLAWTHQYCQSVKHMVKVDEDTFLFVPKLLALLQSTDLRYRRYILGYAHINPAPNVLRKGKWRVDSSLYPYSSYPRYVYGHSYVISAMAIQPILSAFLRTPFITNEDALFTGILPVITGTVRLGHRSFAFVGRHEVECEVVNGRYVSLTSCCKVHHTAIFKSITNGTCNSHKMNELQEPGCKFSKKPSQ